MGVCTSSCHGTDQSVTASSDHSDTSQTLIHGTATEYLRFVRDVGKAYQQEELPVTTNTPATAANTIDTEEVVLEGTVFDPADTIGAEGVKQVQVQVEAVTKPYLLVGKEQEVHCLFNLISPPPSDLGAQSRKPFNLALVLDRSGSMAGSRMFFSKQAVKHIINGMIQEDVLHLVVYDNEYDVVFEHGTVNQREQLLQAVEDIDIGGFTNIMSGVGKAYQLLMQATGTARKLPKRIFLFSDGEVNCGITSKQDMFDIVKTMQEFGVNLSSFGIGSNFDIQVMQGVAEAGHGGYVLLDNVQEIEKKVALATNIITSLVARNATLKVSPVPIMLVQNQELVEPNEKQPSGLNQISPGGPEMLASSNVVGTSSLKQLFGHSDLATGSVLGDMCQDDIRQVLVSATVKVNLPEGTAVSGKISFLEYSFSYLNMHDETVQQEGRVGIQLTDLPEQDALKNDAVLVSQAINEGGLKDKDIIELVNAANEESFQRAIKLKREIIHSLERVQELDKSEKIVAFLLTGHRATLLKMEQDGWRSNLDVVKAGLSYDTYHGASLQTCGLI
mmetsp:Transcript_16859/g.23693  ORF Transcript_16859/g.23693 Transcript_16859/m.23693 type:complete len:559 (-) Transcript_16859:205-1881(-)